MSKYYNYDFFQLSKENVYFLLCISERKTDIENTVQKCIDKLTISSRNMSTIEASQKAIYYRNKTMLADIIHRFVHKYLDISIYSDMITALTDGKGYRSTAYSDVMGERKYFRCRIKEIKNLGYYLVKYGIKDKTVEGLQLKKFFPEYLTLARDIQKRENKKGE